MLVALIMVAVVAASLLFHFLSPWRMTPIASNWGYIDNMMGATFWITAAGFALTMLTSRAHSYRPGRLSVWARLSARWALPVA